MTRSPMPRFENKCRLSWSAEMWVPFASSAVFPLLCPVREGDWIPQWTCEIVHLASGRAELDGIFTTEDPSFGRDVWVISAYQPNSFIQFIRTNRLRVLRYDIHLSEQEHGTRLRWSQTLTALDAAGERHLAEQDAASFEKMVRELEQRITRYLAG